MASPAPGKTNGTPRSGGAPPKLQTNIEALREDREAAERARTVGERIADAVTAFAGSMYSVAFHLLLYGGWLIYNSGFLPVEPFDPFPFVMLAMMASVEAISSPPSCSSARTGTPRWRSAGRTSACRSAC